jgi:hypothetical protein
MDAAQYQTVAEVEFDEVRPDQGGFTLTGRGRDGAEYRVSLRFELPIDARTRAVLGELLTQAGLVVARGAAAGVAPRSRRARRDGAHQP